MGTDHKHQNEAFGSIFMSPPLIAKLLVRALVVGALAAMFLAALPDFESEIRPFDQRILLFSL